jgi:hypothetical protein
MNLIYFFQNFFLSDISSDLNFLNPKRELTKEQSQLLKFRNNSNNSNNFFFFSKCKYFCFLFILSLAGVCVARITETGGANNPPEIVQYYRVEDGCKFARELCLKLNKERQR